MNKRTQPCTIDGCDKRINSRGWCSMHYERWRLYGTTDSPRPTAIERLMSFVAVNEETECWEWVGSRDANGYGRFCIGGRGNTVGAHRAAYEVIVGEIPEGLELDHLCRNPSCVNPMHLDPVTHRENMYRSDAPTIIAWRADQCLSGKHAMTPENTYINPSSGTRTCRTCTSRGRRKNPDTEAAA